MSIHIMNYEYEYYIYFTVYEKGKRGFHDMSSELRV